MNHESPVGEESKDESSPPCYVFEASILQAFALNKLLPSGIRIEAVDDITNLQDLHSLEPNRAKLKKVSLVEAD